MLVFRMKKLQPENRDNYNDNTKQNMPAVTQIIIHMPPGRSGEQQPLVVEGAAKVVPDEESDASAISAGHSTT